MKAWKALSSAMWQGFLRDRTSQFFYFLFPLMFLVLFGLLLGNPSVGRIDIGVVGQGAVIDHLPGQVLEIKRFDTFDAAVDAVVKGDIPAAIRQSGNTIELR